MKIRNLRRSKSKCLYILSIIYMCKALPPVVLWVSKCYIESISKSSGQKGTLASVVLMTLAFVVRGVK